MSAPKQLYRSRSNRILAGVCGGIAEYYNFDPSIVRLAAVALSFVAGAAFVVYGVAWIIVPEKPQS